MKIELLLYSNYMMLSLAASHAAISEVRDLQDLQPPSMYIK